MKIGIFNGYLYPGLYFFNRGYIQNNCVVYAQDFGHLESRSVVL